jgi:hypothetical protein
MMNTATRDHPSNRLDRGEARDLVTACALAIAAVQRERRVSRDLDRQVGTLTPDEQREVDEAFDRYEAAAVTARGIYAAVMADVQPRIVAELRAAGLDDWADAYEADDYRRLAI